MVQAKDLRLGNYIDRGDYVCKVTKIEENGFIAEPLNYKGERFVVQKIQPIPLTPSILERCGFVKDGIDYDFKHLTFQWWDHENTLHWVYSSGDVNVKIISLHQLQNIIFALTGEELEVKL